MSVKQISIFLENKPGTLNELTDILAGNNIDIRALSLSETEGFGILRIIVDDVVETCSVLKNSGYVCKITPVVIAMIPDETGGLNRVLSILKDANVNVRYMYASLGGKGLHRALMIFKVDNETIAETSLREAGISLIEQTDVDTI
ncbi:MAG: ACT domain-containing protein [Candidatus Weimeria sp.]